MPIQGLSEKRRLPRAGIIRLGIKKIKTVQKGGKNVEVEYPAEVDHFVCPEIVQKVYGPEPKALIVMFPVENEEVFFQQWYRRYGNGILLCKGDGAEAFAWDFDKGEMKKIACPCELLKKGACKAVGALQFILPEVEEAAAVWQINTSSKNSIIDINSGIDFIRGIAGRIAMIPLLLKREPLEIHRIEDKEMKTSSHFTMKLSLEGTSLKKLQLMGKIKPTEIMLPAPDESQPEDLFPENGFSPEEEEKKKEKEKKAFEQAALKKLKQDLEFYVKQYESLGSKLAPNWQKRIGELAKKEEFEAAIEIFKTRIERLKKEAEEEAKFVAGGTDAK